MIRLGAFKFLFGVVEVLVIAAPRVYEDWCVVDVRCELSFQIRGPYHYEKTGK